jgi:predicted enzyme related to lactoylglutathione lyase
MPAANRFVWYELMTSDQPAAVEFYCRVAGWTARDGGNPDMPYTLLLADGIQVAGAMTTPPELAAIGHQPVWSGYVGVPEVGAAAARVIAADGKLLRPAAEIPGVGRFAVASDPQGAGFVLFEPAPGELPAVPAPGAPGGVDWRELRAVDHEAALAFYTKVFGWTAGERRDLDGGVAYRLFEIDGAPAGGMMNKSHDEPAPGWIYYINVEAIDAAAARVGEAGGEVAVAPHQVPGGSWILHGRDPQGARFSLAAPLR